MRKFEVTENAIKLGNVKFLVMKPLKCIKRETKIKLN